MYGCETCQNQAANPLWDNGFSECERVAYEEYNRALAEAISGGVIPDAGKIIAAQQKLIADLKICDTLIVQVKERLKEWADLPEVWGLIAACAGLLAFSVVRSNQTVEFHYRRGRF